MADGTESSGSCSRISSPKLGDFAKLQSSSILPCYREKSAKLGDFYKLFARFPAIDEKRKGGEHSILSGRPEGCRSIEPLLDLPPPNTPNRLLLLHDPQRSSSCPVRDIPARRTHPCDLSGPRDPLRCPTPSILSSSVESNLESDVSFEVNTPSVTPASTPPSSAYKPISKSFSGFPEQRVPLKQSTVISRPFAKQKSKPSKSEALVSYQLDPGGPIFKVYDCIRTTEEKHQSLMVNLIPHRASDAAMAVRHPTIASNGVHLFLDLSNIDIGFHKALRMRYSLDEHAYFNPLPHLNLQFLTEVLVRGRQTIVLNVGCSTLPGRPEPRHVRSLRKLGYRVDLRERKRVEESSQSKLSKNSAFIVRHVEDLVDETLQTRMAESVMEYFNEQGTLTIATGDARPAKYSDGFLTYAERALKMGWNVEVVSWKGSLSSAWKNPKWTTQWGDKFRTIELDGFLDDILAGPL